ncbi:MAG TPA: malonate decarboxylase holo-[acyl-carrier-protein] synthase [Burkholderiaceae bacterium]|jgi:phosphoribosyl-dephospho-CoA transferase
MAALHRHQLVRLSNAGWSAVLARPWDAVARACLSHWAARHEPLVVTQQAAGLPAEQLGLGLAAPLRWERRRIALQVPLADVLCFDEFPSAHAVAGLLAARRRGAWLRLADTLVELGAAPRVHGSFGWQQLTGLDYLHAGSDLDLRLSARDAAAADVLAAVLARADPRGPRLDGELVFPDGSAAAWREWRQWRARQVDRLLVKRLRGVSMETGSAWLPQPC